MHFMNPQRGAHLGQAAAPAAAATPDQGAGDGFNHYQIDENEQGASCTHTDPSGQVIPSEHPSLEEAVSSISGQGQDDSKPKDESPAAPPADSDDSGY